MIDNTKDLLQEALKDPSIWVVELKRGILCKPQETTIKICNLWKHLITNQDGIYHDTNELMQFTILSGVFHIKIGKTDTGIKDLLNGHAYDMCLQLLGDERPMKFRDYLEEAFQLMNVETPLREEIMQSYQCLSLD